MPSFNQVVLMGNVTRDVQLKQLPSQQVAAEFGLATNRRYRTSDGEERQETCFVDCTAFGRQAEVLAQYVTKGKPLFVQGRLRYDAWDDRQTGARRSRLTVVVENFQFVGSKDGSGSFEGAAVEAEKRPGDRAARDDAPQRAAVPVGGKGDRRGVPARSGKSGGNLFGSGAAKFKEEDAPF